MWILGNAQWESNEILYSSDGITWIQAESSSPFTPKANPASVVFDDKIWLIGGIGCGAIEVWNSVDGINWTKISNSTSFSPQCSVKAVTSENKIWVIGDGEISRKSDVWTSSDGVTWTEETSNAGFPPREGFTTMSFQDKLWVIGGYGWAPTTGYRFYNDVWYHEVPPTQQLLIDIRDTPTGSLIPNATVGLYDPIHNEWQNTTTPTGTLVFTDAGATHQYPLVIGTNYRVAASADGYVPVVRNVTFTVSGQREMVNLTESAGLLSPTYSITIIENYWPKEVQNNMDLCNLSTSTFWGTEVGDRVSYWLGQRANWGKPVFYHKNENVTKEDFGTQNGGYEGLDDSTFHYYYGHGFCNNCFSPCTQPICQIPSTSGLPLFNWINDSGDRHFYHEHLSPVDVSSKWDKKNKWVIFQTCEAVGDPEWGKALKTSHGILGFKTEIVGDRDSYLLPDFFFKYAIEDKMTIADAWREATIKKYQGVHPYDGVDIEAAVIFNNDPQYLTDHLPGMGPVAPDEYPDDGEITRHSWNCSTPENGEPL